MNEIARNIPQNTAEQTTVKPNVTKLDFGKFSEMPEYIAVNRDLVADLMSRSPNNFTHIDIACGTGMVERLIKAEAEKTGKRGKIIGIDPNATSLAIAQREVVSSPAVSVKFIEGMGQNLKQLLNGEIEDGVDSTSILDAIHEIWNNQDKAEIVKSMADILKPGGHLTLNSAFTTVANLQDKSGWGKWKLLSMQKLTGLQKVPRNRDVDAMPVLSPDEYKKMITDTGLVVVGERTTTVTLTKEALIAIARYPAFFDGTFADMPEQEKYNDLEKSDAMVKAIEELGVPSLKKVWYEIIAQKPSVAPTTVFQS